MPAGVRHHYWSASVLRVLQKATQIRPGERYQTVQEFWNELSDAALPPTRPLPQAAPDFQSVETEAEVRRLASSDLNVEPDEFTKAPPQPRFQPVNAPSPPALNARERGTPYADAAATKRPKIVVPVRVLPTAAQGNADVQRGPSAKERIAALPDQARNGKAFGQTLGQPLGQAVGQALGQPAGRRAGHPRRQVTPARARPYVVAAILILAFAGMLLATHKYVTSHWNPFVSLPQLSDVFIIGREGVTTTDVNLRPDASALKPSIGLAEAGSRVKIVSTADNWYEVQVLQHGRPKSDPFTSDRGWINKKFVKFD
jgi:hypothetical protein